uniref:Uncharacterized protein n=1 Tax=Rhizophora mucronata TaxID=61149 RepID=A0A2P2R1A9_RHIMU
MKYHSMCMKDKVNQFIVGNL